MAVQPKPRWISLPEAEALLDGDLANRDAIVDGCGAAEIRARTEGRSGGFRDLDATVWKTPDTKIDWLHSNITRRGFGFIHIFTDGHTEWTYVTERVELDRMSFLQYFGMEEGGLAALDSGARRGRKPKGRSQKSEISAAFGRMVAAGNVNYAYGGKREAAKKLLQQFPDYELDGIEGIIEPSFNWEKRKRS